jgi:hypothetical protein
MKCTRGATRQNFSIQVSCATWFFHAKQTFLSNERINSWIVEVRCTAECHCEVAVHASFHDGRWEIGARHASTRINHRGSHGAQPGTVTSRQRNENRISNPHHERTHNQISKHCRLMDPYTAHCHIPLRSRTCINLRARNRSHKI